MARTLTAEFIAELTAGTVRIAFALEARCRSQTSDQDNYIRLWTGDYNITFDDQLYYGNGWLMSFSSISETQGLAAKGMEVHLNGLNQDLLSTLLNVRQNETGRFYILFLNDSGEIIGSDLRFIGKLDTSEIQQSADRLDAIIHYENILMTLSRPRERRYSNEAQKQIDASDKGFEYIESVAAWDGYWGRPQSGQQDLRGG